MVLAGRSMGAAAALLAAAEGAPVRALVLDSPFADLSRLADEILRRMFLPPWPFRTLAFRLAGWRADYDPELEKILAKKKKELNGGKWVTINKPTICTNCEFFGVFAPHAIRFYEKCTSPEAPPTDFIYGEKQAREINTLGVCPYYKARKINGL